MAAREPRSLNWGMVTVGSLAGGYLGGALGLPWALAAGSVMSVAAVGWIAVSPVRQLRAIPSDVRA